MQIVKFRCMHCASIQRGVINHGHVTLKYEDLLGVPRIHSYVQYVNCRSIAYSYTTCSSDWAAMSQTIA